VAGQSHEGLRDQLGLTIRTGGKRTPTKTGTTGNASQAIAQLALFKLAKEELAPLLGSLSTAAAIRAVRKAVQALVDSLALEDERGEQLVEALLR